MDDKLKLFVPFTKKDEDKKQVAGYASTEALDSDGEIVEKEAVTKALPHYLGEYDHKQGRYKLGGLREMHQLSAVGKTLGAKVDDKGLYITGKVVDNNAWTKVKEGVYTGFSIGGKIVNRIQNRIKEITMTEISLVDRPANPEAVFAMVKIDKTGKVTDMQKQLATEAPSSIPYEEVYTASTILSLARDLRILIIGFESEGRSTRELETAIKALKRIAAKVLNEEDKKKFEKILYYSLAFEEMETDHRQLAKKTPKEKKGKMVDLAKHIDLKWASGYFETMRKAIG